MTYFKDDEGNFYLRHMEIFHQRIRYFRFLNKVVEESETPSSFGFIGGEVLYNGAVTLHIDTSIGVRLDLYLGSGKEFCERFPNLEELHKHIVYIMESFTIDGRIGI